MRKFSTEEATINKVIRFPKSLNDKIEEQKNKNRTTFQLEVVELLHEALAHRDELAHYDAQQHADAADVVL